MPVLPDIQTSKVEDVNELLNKDSSEGLKEKLNAYVFPFYSENEKEDLIKKYNKRLDHEISIISKMKYAGYFLIVADYIKWAKKK